MYICMYVYIYIYGFTGYGLERLQLEEIEDALAGQLYEDVSASHSAARNLKPHHLGTWVLSLGIWVESIDSCLGCVQSKSRL